VSPVFVLVAADVEGATADLTQEHILRAGVEQPPD
jgi:hypothetical protein